MTGDLRKDRQLRNYHRSLAHAVYGIPLVLVTACFVYRAFDNNWPVLVQVGFGGFVLLLGTASTHRAFRTGIDVASSGVAIVNLVRTEHLAWHDVKGFEIGSDGGLWTSVVVTSRDGKRIPAAGLRLWGGDPNTLMPDVEGLRADQATAERASGS